jgi:hypothetical protein
LHERIPKVFCIIFSLARELCLYMKIAETVPSFPLPPLPLPPPPLSLSLYLEDGGKIFTRTDGRPSTRCNRSPRLPPSNPFALALAHAYTCCDSGMITDDLSVTGCRYRGWIIVLIAKYEIIRERDRRPSIIGQRWPLVRRRSFIILAQPSPSSYSHRIADVPLFVYR